MDTAIEFIDLKRMDFKEAWEYQVNLFEERVSYKFDRRKNPDTKKRNYTDVLLFVEHPHVYTLGKSGNQKNLLITEDFLRKIEASYYHIDRGGDITYHGPGQIVGYPIFDLERYNIHIKQYVHGLEEAIINTLKRHYKLEADRLEGATGVWLDTREKQPRKICAIGVKASRHITMHGFAFNVNTNLKYFDYINPCGFQDKGVTSLEAELGREQNLDEAKQFLKNNIIEYFDQLNKNQS